MGVGWLLACHGLVTALVVVSFLCGRWPIFEGTFIQRINYFLTFGAYDYFLRFVGAQVPGYCLSGIDKHILPGVSFYAAAVGILLFLLTSFSDPWTINAENVSQYLAAYSHDNIIYAEKECSTCKIPKPARSKHCSICDHCVARVDHHWGWMNNCIGKRNTRYFMAFLLWHFLLCMYGTVAIGLISSYWKTKRIESCPYSNSLLWNRKIFSGFSSSCCTVVVGILQHSDTLLIVFVAIVGMLLAGFFGYHAKLCLSNTTTNETFN